MSFAWGCEIFGFPASPYLFVYIQEDLSKVADRRSACARQMTVINKRYDDAVIGIVQPQPGTAGRARSSPKDLRGQRGDESQPRR